MPNNAHAILICLLALVIGTAPAFGQSCGGESVAADPAAPAPTTALGWLDRLEAAGKDLKTYQAKVIYDRRQELLGDRVIRMGDVHYMAGPPARFAIRFDKMVVGQELRDRPRHYIFDGSWLVEKHANQRQFIKRQVVAPGQTFDPLKLGSGPFPLPLGQKREDVQALFKVTLAEPTEDDPPTSVHLQLVPHTDPATGKPTSPFTRVDLWYDKATLMPVRVVTMDDSENKTTVRLEQAKINTLDEPSAKALFDTTTPKQGAGWKVQIIPWQDPTPATPSESN
jgi:hypothetical protein